MALSFKNYFYILKYFYISSLCTLCCTHAAEIRDEIAKVEGAVYYILLNICHLEKMFK